MEKPIIFSTPMVQAILAGKKTQTRRVIQPQPTLNAPLGFCMDSTGGSKNIGKYGFGLHESGSQIEYCKPRYQSNDVLWVRETWQKKDCNPCPAGDFPCSLSGCVFGEREYLYAADDYTQQPMGNDVSLYDDMKWRSPMYMPRAAARIFLRVTDVRVERLQNISIDDAKAEGDGWDTKTAKLITEHVRTKNAYIASFAGLWDSINKKRGFGWESNPFVWAYTFERIG